MGMKPISMGQTMQMGLPEALWGRGAHPHPPPIPKVAFPLNRPPERFLMGMKPISMGQTMQMGVPEALWVRGGSILNPPPPPMPPPIPKATFPLYEFL